MWKTGFFFLKRGSSNLSVYKVRIVLRISVFVSVSNEVLPYKRVCVK